MEQISATRYNARMGKWSGDLYIILNETGRYEFMFVSEQGRAWTTQKPSGVSQVRHGGGYLDAASAWSAAKEFGIHQVPTVPEPITA